MVLLLASAVFLTNLLCATVPCQLKYPQPEIASNPHLNSKYNELNNNQGGFWNSVGFRHRIDNNDNQNRYKKHNNDHHEDPLVMTTNGLVEGYKMKVVSGKVINAFEGIPYAEGPLGKLRFRLPVPKRPWKGVLKAKAYGPRCLQYSVTQGFRVVGQENCLFVNVYSPELPSVTSPEPKIPVIVFIHGGGFFLGSAVPYGPSYLLQKNVILVTLQYRLGVLGFMSTGDHVSPGNNGLKDQALALKWVHENIHLFGGDTSRVTLMGQSAGSSCVHMHMLSKTTRAYFQAAVSISGTAFNYWSIFTPPQTRNLTNVLAHMVGCPTHSSKKLVDCLRRQNPVNLVKKTPRLLDDFPNPSNAFRPSIEVTYNNPSAFLTELPEVTYAKNDVYNVPWIATSVSGEGYTFLLVPFATTAFLGLRMNWEKRAPDLVDIENLNVNFDVVTKKVTEFYFRNISPHKAPVGLYANIITDRMFVTGLYKSLQAHSLIAPTYSYVFDYNGQYNGAEVLGIRPEEWGVGHAEDLFYFFNGSTVYSGFRREDPEFQISEVLVNLVTNFATKGEPLYTQSTGEDVKVWNPINGPDDLQFLKIDRRAIRMIKDPFLDRIRFWENLQLPDTPGRDFLNYMYKSLNSVAYKN